MHTRILLLALAAVALSATVALAAPAPKPSPTADPYAAIENAAAKLGYDIHAAQEAQQAAQQADAQVQADRKALAALTKAKSPKK